jgi:hypothetical protein
MLTAQALTDDGHHIPSTIDELRCYLQAAVEVEHLTIPVYMTGMYTIRPGTNQFAHTIIRSILLEEMLHLTLAANLLTAVGGTPNIACPEFVAGYPARLPFSDPSLPPIPLQHFSPEALRTFLLIERPRSTVSPPPHQTGWTSIGQFYDAILRGITRLEDQQREAHRRDPHKPATIFTGRPEHQVGPEDFYNSGGEVFAITDLSHAKLAIQVISDQGEGADKTIWDSDDKIFGEERQPAHYYRFNEILTGRRYSRHDVPGSPPSGPDVDVTWNDTHRIFPDAKVADYPLGSEARRQAQEFNHTYAVLLILLERAFRGAPQLMRRAVPLMLELRDLAQRLYRNPHPDPAKARAGLSASPTFELTDEHFVAAQDHPQLTCDADTERPPQYIPSQPHSSGASRMTCTTEDKTRTATDLPELPQGFTLPFYYGTFTNLGVDYLLHSPDQKERVAALLAQDHAGRHLSPALFDGAMCLSMNYQLYFAQFEESSSITQEIEFNVVAYPTAEASRVPTLTYSQYAQGTDRTGLIGFCRVHVACDNKHAIDAGRKLFNEPKRKASFAYKMPVPNQTTANPAYADMWKITCGEYDGDLANDDEVFLRLSVNLQGLTGRPVSIAPFTEYGSRPTGTGDRGYRPLAAPLNVFSPYQWFDLHEHSCTDPRVILTLGLADPPRQAKEYLHLINDQRPAGAWVYQSAPVAAQNRPYWVTTP